jgi:hypothetical protein
MRFPMRGSVRLSRLPKDRRAGNEGGGPRRSGSQPNRMNHSASGVPNDRAHRRAPYDLRLAAALAKSIEISSREFALKSNGTLKHCLGFAAAIVFSILGHHQIILAA